MTLLLFVKFHTVELFLVSMCTRTIMICNDHNTDTFILKPPNFLVLTPSVEVSYIKEQTFISTFNKLKIRFRHINIQLSQLPS